MNLHVSPPLPVGSCGLRTDVPAPAFFRMREVQRITGLSRPTLYRRIAASRFPPPVHLGGRACGWPCAALNAWIADPDGYRSPQAAPEMQPRRRGRPRKYAV
jgi:predicted DNA-binding transcriptional regulator AlpA